MEIPDAFSQSVIFNQPRLPQVIIMTHHFYRTLCLKAKILDSRLSFKRWFSKTRKKEKSGQPNMGSHPVAGRLWGLGAKPQQLEAEVWGQSLQLLEAIGDGGEENLQGLKERKV